MLIKFILTDSLADLQRLSSGRFYADTDFLSNTSTRVIVIGSKPNFDTLDKSIQKELDSVLLSRDDELVHHIYSAVDLEKYAECDGFGEFIFNNSEINPIEDYYIQYEDYADYIFAKEKPMAFADVLHGLKNDLLIAHRLSKGISICASQTDNEFLTESGTSYNLTSEDILADDWINSSYTLYPTTVKYDKDNSMCKLYYDLHDTKSHLPYSDLFYFITHGKDYFSHTRYGRDEIFIITRLKDRFNFFNSLLNNIVKMNATKTIGSTIELFDPSLPVENQLLNVADKTFFDQYGYSIDSSRLMLIIDSDTLSQEDIDHYLTLTTPDRILVKSFSEML